MTKKRKIGLGILSCSLIAATCFSFFSLNGNKPVRAEEISSEGYFSSTETITVQENIVDTKGISGVSVTLEGIEGKNKASFEYKNYIDASTLAKGFLELSLSPSSYGKTDNDFMIVTLTDALNEDEKLVWAVAAVPDSAGWWNTYCAAWVSYVDTLTTGLQPSYNSTPIMKIEGTSQAIHGQNGFMSTAHGLWYSTYMDCGYLLGAKNQLFVQSNESAKLNSMNFVFDGTSAKINGGTIANLQDPEFMYYSSRYLSGTQYAERYTSEYAKNLFSSGYCTLKVEYQGINNDSVTCHIKSIGGQKFADNDNCAVNSASPLIKADISQHALVDYEYTIPRVYSHDIIDGDLSNNVTVKILNSNGQTVHTGFSNYQFTEEGSYVIEYTVTNLRGVTFTKNYYIKCYGEVPYSSFGFVTDYKENYIVGEAIVLPSTMAKNDISVGGAIEADVLIQRNGCVIDKFANTMSRKYTLTQDGEYAIVFRYTNAYGISDSEVRRFSVDKGVLINAMPPVSFMVGKVNTLYDFNVENYYNDIDVKDIYRAIFVNGTNVYTAKGNTVVSGALELAASTFAEKDTATVEYKVGFDGNTYAFSESYVIPVIKPKYIGDYLIPYTANGVYTDEKSTIINQKENTAFETTINGGFVLPQAISEENLLLTFNAREGKSNFDTLTLVLEDFENRDKKLSFVLSAIDEKSSMLNVQGENYMVDGSLIAPNAKFDFVWDFKAATLCDSLGIAFTDKIIYWDNGEKFNGFAKGIILHFEFDGVSDGGAGIEIQTIGNQTFVSTVLSSGIQPVMDMFAPYIQINGDYANATTNFGEKLKVYEATAYDILDAMVTLYVTVTAPDGTVILNNVSCDKDYAITLNQLGKYTVAYTAYDSTDIVRQPKRFTFNVTDKQNPTLTITQPPKELYAVGQTIEFGKIYAFDNYTEDCEVSVYVVADDGERELVKDSYTFTKAGAYRIIFYTIDTEFNYSMVSYNIKVSGGVK